MITCLREVSEHMINTRVSKCKQTLFDGIKTCLQLAARV